MRDEFFWVFDFRPSWIAWDLGVGRPSILFVIDTTPKDQPYLYLLYSKYPDSTMFRRSVMKLAGRPHRTIVRDPRKQRAMKGAAASEVPAEQPQQSSSLQTPPSQPPPQQYQQQPLPFTPNSQNQESLGSSLMGYAVAGFGMALGVTLVRVVIGF